MSPKLVKGNGPPPPRINKELQDKFLARDQAYHNCKSSNNHVDKMTFKDLRSECQHLWREAMLSYTEVQNNTEEDITSLKRTLVV